VLEFLLPGQEGFEPGPFCRAVVEDQIRHQPERRADIGDIRPVADGRIDLIIVDDGKAVVGTVGKKGQDMDAADHVFQVFVCEGLQGPKVPAVLGCQGQYRTVVFNPPADTKLRLLFLRRIGRGTTKQEAVPVSDDKGVALVQRQPASAVVASALVAAAAAAEACGGLG
jgi:hypothetical protein